MHYGAYDFSSNGQKTIEVKQSGKTIGQRNGLSFTDQEEVRKAYQCTRK